MATQLKTIEEQQAEAQVVVARNLSKTEGFIVRAPIYGTAAGVALGKDVMNVLRHVNKDGRHIDGGAIVMFEGQGYTENADWAEWIRQNWSEEGYTVRQITRLEDEDGGYLYKVARLGAIVDEADGK